ncbi:MAG: hypothetical protein AAGD92_15790 [Pseudomonadota bacterium]
MAAVITIGNVGGALAASDATGAIKDYVRSRLTNDRAALVRPRGEVYSATAVINGRAWSGMVRDVVINECQYRPWPAPWAPSHPGFVERE